MKTEIIVAIIAAIGVWATVVGSIRTTNTTNKAQLEAQRIEAVRNMKRTYYASFIDAYTKKMEYVFMPDCIEKAESNMRFVEEATRLPLYASQAVVELIERIKTASPIDPKELFELIRADLCSNAFEPFDGLDSFIITLPDQVVVEHNGIKQLLSKNG